MILSKRRQLLAILTALGLLVFSNAVFAQDDPEAGDIGEEEDTGSVGGEWGGTLEGQTSTSTDSASQWQADSTATTSDSDSSTSLSGSDHDSVVGSVGIGFFGINEIPVGIDPNAPDEDSISAPTIGLRYWLSSLLGVEVAVGIGITSNSTESGGVSVDQPSHFAFALHGGIPLALAHTGHFAFEVIPDLNFGVSTGSSEGDVDYSGLLLQVGGRLGAELQFGFVDVPQLSLLTSFGVHFSYESRTTSTAAGDASQSRVFFGTTIGSEPWRSFMGSINLLYYL